MAKNLNVGTQIFSGQNPSNNGTIEKYCYSNDTDNCDLYGALYNWKEAMNYTTTPGIQGICPEGWRIPTTIEWQNLNNFASPDPACKLKINASFAWNVLDCITDQFGFSAMGAGKLDGVNFIRYVITLFSLKSFDYGKDILSWFIFTKSK